MIVSGFGKDTMKKVFDWFINDPFEDNNGFKRPFQTRLLSHTGEGNNPNLSVLAMKREDELFKNDMAFLYLKTFYGKTTHNFKTIEYQMESEKFNLYLNSHPMSEKLNSIIQKCLRKKSVDFVKGELPRDIFYDRLKFGAVGLSTNDSDLRLFVTPSFVPQARIYINPSLSDYRHLLVYIITNAAFHELELGVKTRMGNIKTTDSLNNLILYTSSKDFMKVINILDSYAKRFPDKVADFGGTLETAGRTSQEWYGFGFEPQRSNLSEKGLSTFSTVIEDIFNCYVLTTATLDDFAKITKNLTIKELKQIFTETGVCTSQETAKEIALSLYDIDLTKQIIKDFCDLTYLNNRSNSITTQNGKLKKASRNGLSTLQLRNDKDMPSDITLLKRETIAFPLHAGGFIMMSRQRLSQMLRSPILRKEMMKFYELPEESDKQVSQMTWLWNHIGKNMPYLFAKNPFLSIDIAKQIKPKEKKADIIKIRKETKKYNTIKYNIEEKHKLQVETIRTLCGGKHELSAKLVELRNFTPQSLRNLTREDMEKKIINFIGIDYVIEASAYFKSKIKDKEKIHSYEISLKELRQDRGIELARQLKELQTNLERKRFSEKLSKYATEDIVRAYQSEKAMQKFDDFIKSLYY